MSSVLSEIRSGLGIITLNVEKRLNALSQEMILELTTLLRRWSTDKSVAAIFLQGSGDKAFCAGGDIRYLYDAIQRNEFETCLKFFITEYTLDHLIHTYEKPVIVWATGITMGGGMGLMNGSSHRIVTESSKLAMPEISIGLYPDVGATWFLNQLPPGFGLFLGVTAARLQASDALELGLADFYLSSQTRADLLQRLQGIPWSSEAEANHALVTKVIKALEAPRPGTANARDFKKDISQFEHVRSVDEFKSVLSQMPGEAWFDEARDLFRHGSPISHGISIEQIRRGRGLSLEDAFRSELNLSVHCSRKPDFPEGVRALLVDKDKSPKWRLFTEEEVQSYFTPLWTAETHPLRGL